MSIDINKTTIKITDYTITPGPRKKEWGEFSGEEFREDILIPWLEKHKEEEKLTIKMDGVVSYPPSFLEEAFGGAVRKGYAPDIEKIEFHYTEVPYKIELLKDYIALAKKEKT